MGLDRLGAADTSRRGELDLGSRLSVRRDAPNRSRTEKEHQELRCNHSFGFVEQVAILNSSVSGFIHLLSNIIILVLSNWN